MKVKPIFIYFIFLAILCAGFVAGARMMGRQGMYLAGGYMLTPALAAFITRLFFHHLHFQDANLRFGRFGDYIRFWLYSLGLAVLTVGLFTLFGAIRWDFSGKIFLGLLEQQFAAAGDDMAGSLPPGFTPRMMLGFFFLGGLTVFNILPGLITGFGEEFGHRGFMFPNLLPGRPWLGLVIGGFIWYLWHQPLALIFPPGPIVPLWQALLTYAAGIIGTIAAHIYFCYIYAKSRSIFVPSVAHIAWNNAAGAFAYFFVVQNQLAATLVQSLIMVPVVVLLYYSREMDVVFEFLSGKTNNPAISPLQEDLAGPALHTGH